MFTRSLVIVGLLIGSFFVSFPSEITALTGNSVSTVTASEGLCEGCYTERILIEGQWYIVVYAPDGSIIDIYPDWDE
jgi:hypothetical protein